MSNHMFIADMEPNQFLEGIYAIYNCQLGQSKNGKPYVKCLVGDKTGRTPARMWSVTDAQFAALPTNGFAWITGSTQPYQGEMQVIIQQMEAARPGEADMANLLPTTRNDIDKMFAALSKVMESLQNEHLRRLALRYLADEELMKKFRRAPAAQSLHHAYIGGLLEHTLSLLRLGHVICPLYPGLNRELVMVGLFLHDMGKCVELTWETGFAYSTDGQLVGHIARGSIWLQQKADACAAEGNKIPEPLLRALHHIILSHHGTPEFGALKVPATPEALAVSMLDNLDAKLHIGLMATRDPAVVAKADELGGSFTEKIWALDTRMYRPDPTTLPDEA